MNTPKTLAALFVSLAILSCAKVEEGPVAVTSVKLDKNELTIVTGSVKYLCAEVLPENATDKTVTWSSSNPEVATVASDGTVNGISEGEAVITALAGECKDECKVSVVKEKILATSASLSPESLSLYANETAVLALTYTPSVITEDYIWSSSDTTVAVVDSLGNVTGVAQGDATITVMFVESGIKASSTVSVTEVMKLRRLDSGEIRTSDYNMLRIKRVDTLCVARGEVADFQINVEAYETLSNLQAELVYFCKDQKNPSVALDPKVFWTGKVYCTRYWNDWQGGYPWNELNPTDRMFPDILIPVEKKALNINRNDNNSFWFDFSIPRDFEDGLYFGKVKVTASLRDKEVVGYQDFQVRVFPVTLPEEQSLMVINWHNSDYSLMADGPIPEGKESEFTWNMRGKIVNFMYDYGQNGWPTRMCPVTTCAKPSVVGGKIVYDFSEWLYELDFYDEHCPDLKMLQSFCFAGCMDNKYWDSSFTVDDLIVWRVWYLDEGGQLQCASLPASDPRTHDYLVDFFSQLSEVLHNHTLSNGRKLIDVYAQSIMDEPYDWHKPGYEMIASAIKEGCPDLKIMEPTEAPSISEYLMDWPLPNLDQLTNNYDKYKARDPQQQWLYLCLRPQGNIANRIFGQRVLNCRITHWCNYRYDAIGYLHWGLCCWGFFDWHDRCFPDDAYDSDYLGTSPGGDAFIIYPGEMEVYPSIRLSNMRDGVRDYELLKMIEKINPTKARDFCYKVVYENPVSYAPSAKSKSAQYKFYDENIDHFRKTRREMLEYLKENGAR